MELPVYFWFCGSACNYSTANSTIIDWGKGNIAFHFLNGSFFLILFLTQPFEQKVQSLRISEFKENALNFTKTYKFKTSPQGTTSESKREH